MKQVRILISASNQHDTFEEFWSSYFFYWMLFDRNIKNFVAGILNFYMGPRIDLLMAFKYFKICQLTFNDLNNV